MISPHIIQMISYVLSLIGLYSVLQLGLLTSLFSGLVIYAVVQHFATRFAEHRRGRVTAVALIASLVIVCVLLLTWGAVHFFQSDSGNFQHLFQKLADILDRSREQIPLSLQSYIPESADALREMITHWFREHAAEAKLIGAEAGRGVAHALVGMIIGAMAALHHNTEQGSQGVLAIALRERLHYFELSFRKIVFAQARISAINTVITAAYLLIILPILGISLPFSKTLVMFTFLAGLLPVIGNIASNSVMVILGLSYSIHVALACLIFLVVIHKLEYFLNARIIGSQIHASTWELLLVLLVMESWWGISGVVAAPIYYAYMKQELMNKKLI